MKVRIVKLLIITVGLFFLLTTKVSAATLELQPASISQNVGDKFKVDLVLSVGAGESVWGYDAYIKFPSTDLTYSAVDFVPGAVFQTGGKTVSSVSGSFISVGGYFDTTTQGTTTGGVVASLYFTGSQAATGAIEVVCNQFTNIYSSGAVQTSLFNTCLTLSPKTSYTIAGGSGVVATATPQPTATSVPAVSNTPAPTTAPGSPTNTPQPTAVPTTVSTTTTTVAPTGTGALTVLPETGMFDVLLRFIYGGLTLILIGVLFSFGFSKTKKK
jgi:hypothetical protein